MDFEDNPNLFEVFGKIS